MRRLEKLAPWRIDPASIKFPEDGYRFEGRYATVFRGPLGCTPDDTIDQFGESRDRKAKPRDRIVEWECDSNRQHSETDDDQTNYNNNEGTEGQERRYNGEQRWKVGRDQALCTSSANR